MVKTFGSIDRKRRKTRKDKGKRRKTYGGKPTKRKRKKHGRLVPYEPKRRYNDPIKLWWWEALPMSMDGNRRFSKETRRHMRRTIYKQLHRFDAMPEQVNTRDKIEAIAEEQLWGGVFLLMGFSKGKNKFHTKPVCLAKIRIKESSEGNKARIIENRRLFRYWFWSK